MKPLREMADNKRCSIYNMDICLKFLENLENLTSTAFGPEGRAIMIQKPTGQLSITRSGHNIICSAFLESHDKHPVLHMLLKYVDSVHESLGDGTKTFIIMLASLLRYSKVVENRPLFIRHLNAFQACLSELMCSSELSVINTNVLNVRETCFNSFVSTFFSTRFSEPVKNVLCPLMHKWIMSYSNGCDQEKHPYSSSILKMLQKNFAYLCEYRDNNGRPVIESNIQKGFRIACLVSNLLSPGLKKPKFLMLEDGENAESGQFTKLDIESEISRILVTGDGKGMLLITSAVLSDLTLFRLRCSHISVLHGLQHEDVNFIYSTIFHTNKTKEVVIYVGTVVESGKEFVHLDLPDTFQLHICGPTSELNAEYAKECYNVLKLLMHAASTGIPHIVETGGVFEKCLSIEFMSSMDKSSCIPLLGLARSRAELLELHKELQKLSVKKKSEFVNSGGGSNGGSVNNGGGGGSTPNPVIDINKSVEKYEQLQSSNLPCVHDFKKICNTNISADESCSIISTLLAQCYQMDEIMLRGIAFALMSVQRKLPAKKETLGLEPLGLKLSILLHVVNAAVSLLRIDEN